MQETGERPLVWEGPRRRQGLLPQDSCLEKSRDRGLVGHSPCGVGKRRTQLRSQASERVCGMRGGGGAAQRVALWNATSDLALRNRVERVLEPRPVR